MANEYKPLLGEVAVEHLGSERLRGEGQGVSLHVDGVSFYVKEKRNGGGATGSVRRMCGGEREEDEREKKILHEAECFIPSGSLTAIMGPSGAGKSLTFFFFFCFFFSFIFYLFIYLFIYFFLFFFFLWVLGFFFFLIMCDILFFFFSFLLLPLTFHCFRYSYGYLGQQEKKGKKRGSCLCEWKASNCFFQA